MLKSSQLANQFSSPSDPLFYLHHANVDRLWAKWQAKGEFLTPNESQRDGSRLTISVADISNRTKDIAGPIMQFAHPFHFFDTAPEASDPVTLDTPLRFSGLLSDDVVVGDAMDTRAGRLCYTYDKL
jgi:tyrosinase